MRALRSIIAIGAALVLQSVLAQLIGAGRLPVNLVLTVVVVVALLYGRVAGLLAGSLGGLAQDALAGGIMGIGGMAGSLAGFLAGYMGTQFIVTQAAPRFLLFGGATVVNGVVFMGLYELLGLRRFGRPYVELTLEALINAAAGVVLIWVIEILPSVPERWRNYRERRRKVRHY